VGRPSGNPRDRAGARGPRARFVAAAVVTAALAASCGGGDEPRLSRTQYTKRASEHCATLKEASTRKRLAQSPGATGATVSKSLRGAADGLRDLVRGFRGLTPPAALERDADELVRILDEYADGLDDLAGDVGPNQTLGDASAAHPDQIDHLNAIANRATGLVTRLGLTDCLLSP
jgi:hypothetical protein